MQGGAAEPGIKMVNIEFHGVKTLSKSGEIQPFFSGVGQDFPHGALVVRYR